MAVVVNLLYLLILYLFIPEIKGQVVCPPRDVSFELITGYVFTSPDTIVDTRPGVLKIEDCIDACRRNSTCLSVNYETGLCVLFSGSAEETPGALSPSQFPVFTLYAQKICVRASRSRCTRSWIFDRVSSHKLEGLIKKTRNYASREDCMASCIASSQFTCRSVNYNVRTGECALSVNYNVRTGECALSEMDRSSVANPSEDFKLSLEHEYMESNCASDPVSECQFRPIKGLILKTVDSVYQNIASIEMCKQLCISADFRCRSFDFGDTGPNVCRLSHHSTSTLLEIEEPYLPAEKATNYELGACYNVTVECRSSYMVAKVRTNRVFDGRMYGKTRPNSCTIDVRKSLDFELYLGFNDIDCDVRQVIPGKFATDVIIQHHDMIVTSDDVGLEVKCNYNLANRTISHSADLAVDGDLYGASAEQTIVQAPNVTMRITDRVGQDINSAKVGDRLGLRFEIQDQDSPYEIFVRELIASDGIDASEILLIDSIGCPTDYSIMGVLNEVNGKGQKLQANFEAFKFPTSSVVQFRALVTPCIPRCDPVICDLTDHHGSSKTMTSHGKKRKKRSAKHDIDTKDDDVMVAGVIHISDQFELKHENPTSNAADRSTTEWTEEQFNNCQNEKQTNEEDKSFFTFALGATLFLLAQCILIAGWTCVYLKHKNQIKNENINSTREYTINPITGGAIATTGDEQPYRDYDPYLTNIFRETREPVLISREISSDSTPESSLDLHSLNQRQLILTHLERGSSRKP